MPFYNPLIAIYWVIPLQSWLLSVTSVNLEEFGRIYGYAYEVPELMCAGQNRFQTGRPSWFYVFLRACNAVVSFILSRIHQMSPSDTHIWPSLHQTIAALACQSWHARNLYPFCPKPLVCLFLKSKEAKPILLVYHRKWCALALPPSDRKCARAVTTRLYKPPMECKHWSQISTDLCLHYSPDLNHKLV